MLARLLLLSVFAAQAQAQTQQDDPKELLQRVRARLMETIGRLPKYMCTLAVDRAQYRLDGLQGAPSCDTLLAGKDKARAKLHLVETDRLRLDVAISDTANEIYSWVGEDRFGDRDLFQIVGAGALQTGSYSIFLSSIFGGTAASFSYNGDVVAGGRTLSEFGFEVPREKSNYVFVNGRERVTSAYGGTFLVDPKSGELKRLLVRTSQLPPDVGSCQATTTLDYDRVHFNDLDFLLPRQVQLDIIATNGDELRNRSVYSACHEFRGESTVVFDEAPAVRDPAQGKASTAGVLALPPGIPFTVVSTQPVDPATAAAGDRLKGKLNTAIRDASSHVLVPEGSEVMARIVKLEHFYGPPSSFTIGIRLETVNTGGTPHAVTATASASPGDRRFDKRTGLQRRVQLGTFDTLDDRSTETFEFRDTRQRSVVESGLESTWVTAEP